MPEDPPQAGPGRLTLGAVIAISLVAVSFAAIFIRLAAAPALVVAFYRLLIASLVMLPVTVRSLARTPLRGKALASTVLAGALLAVHFATWISSLSFTTVAASVTLAATSPLWAALIAWLLFSVAPTLSVMFGVLLAVAGAAIIGFGDLAAHAGMPLHRARAAFDSGPRHTQGGDALPGPFDQGSCHLRLIEPGRHGGPHGGDAEFLYRWHRTPPFGWV